jgi:hypothetical protein
VAVVIMIGWRLALRWRWRTLAALRRIYFPNNLSKKLARFGEGAPRSDCPTVPCTTPETVYDHATPRHPYNLHLHLALYYATPAPCR